MQIPQYWCDRIKLEFILREDKFRGRVSRLWKNVPAAWRHPPWCIFGCHWFVSDAGNMNAWYYRYVLQNSCVDQTLFPNFSHSCLMERCHFTKKVIWVTTKVTLATAEVIRATFKVMSTKTKVILATQLLQKCYWPLKNWKQPHWSTCLSLLKWSQPLTNWCQPLKTLSMPL